MQHIGTIIREKRREKHLSAEFIAMHLKHPITKQAFTRKERTGSFSYALVLEVATLLDCSIAELEKQLNSSSSNKNSTA